ncbi:MAG: hypothetical protein ABIG42_01525 [bacterium]
MVVVKTKKTKQITARLKTSTHKALKVQLDKDELSQQEFIDTIVKLYIAGKLKLARSLNVNFSPTDELHIQLLAGDGYRADSVEDLMDQLEGRTDLKPISRTSKHTK